MSNTNGNGEGYRVMVRVRIHPGMEREFAGEKYREQRVVKDGRLITSRGPGTALEFALVLVAELCGAAKAAAVAGPMVVD